MPRSRFILPLVLALLAPRIAGATLSHRGFFEAVAGGHVPLAGEHYTDMFGPGALIGVRGGAYQATPPGVHGAFALEFGFEWAHPTDDVPDRPEQSYRFDEWRCLFGARYLYFLRPELHLYARATGGVEVLAIGGTTRVAGVAVSTSAENAGVTAQLGVGSSWRLGRFNLGVELMVPWSLHRDDGNLERYGVSTSYDALSVDVLFTVSTRR